MGAASSHRSCGFMGLAGTTRHRPKSPHAGSRSICGRGTHARLEERQTPVGEDRLVFSDGICPPESMLGPRLQQCQTGPFDLKCGDQGPDRRRHKRMMTIQADDDLSFGPFNLAVSERLLTRDNLPVELGARALDLLVVLISRPNEVVGKNELMARVWPDVIVEEGSLRFHMTGLRRVLGDGKNGARYITTIRGRGYCFVAPVSRTSARQDVAPVATASFPHANLPNRLGRMIGRDEDLPKLSAQLMASRFVTVVGAGGIGKTTVAIAVAHHLADAFSGFVLFVDLGVLNDLNLVSSAIASMLGVSVQSSDATPGLIAYLRDKRILLILD